MKGALNIQFLQDGGVPLTNNLMADIMEAISIYNVLGELAGNLTIIQGCEVEGSWVHAGVVYINGDLLPFEGGNISESIIVEETTINKTFENLETKGLIYRKKARFGLGETEYPWSDFRRLKTLRQIATELEGKALKSELEIVKQQIAVLQLKTAPIINGGVIWAFNRPASEIPAGWKECTDIRGKTIVGWNPDDSDFSTLKGTLGSKTHTLSINEMPSHKHKVPLFANGSATGNAVGHPDNYIDYNRTVDSETVGGNQPHNNIQPSRIALFIEPNFETN
ncbi:phage baseplate protein [Soonwooa sp.]|uniref:phage baseplate protein n=1 Tax=Soonwooa sp. TaxID=1938592 RepID=UPI0028A9A10D|nr:hypothetical protein [Soonwooa sp.]